MNDFVEGVALWLARVSGTKSKNPKKVGLIIMLIGFVGIQVLLVLALL